jgi:hypothetical protein
MLGLVLGIPLWGLFAAALGPWVAVMIMVSVWPVTLLMFVCPFFWMIR